MHRFLYVETWTADGDSVEEARACLSAKGIPAAMHRISEKVTDDSPRSCEAFGDRIHAARAEAYRQVPSGSASVRENVVILDDGRFYEVEAPDPGKANWSAAERLGEPFFVRRATGDESCLMHFPDTKLLKAGSKGFLGFGRTEPRYRVEVVRKAYVQLTYRARPTVAWTVGVEIGSSRTLQRCMDEGNISPVDDYNGVAEELKAEGQRGSLALARLIRECVDSRTAEAGWAVAAAREAEPTRELSEALEYLASSPPLRDGDGKHASFPPELIGSDRFVIGWADATFDRLKREAQLSLEAIAAKGEAAEPLPGKAILACARSDEAAWLLVDREWLCRRHHEQWADEAFADQGMILRPSLA
jgi:hypothetical protein